MKLTKVALAASLITAASLANASDIKYGLQLGYANGGDKIVTETDSETLTIDAGDGVLVGVYLAGSLNDDGFGYKIAVNNLEDSMDGSQGKIKFSRLPIDLLLSQKVGRLELNGGVTYHINTKFTDTTDSDNFSVKAKNALGLALEANYQVYGNDYLAVDLGLRYTNIDYKFKNEGSTKFDGSSLAFTAGVSF
jgi:opacity protein-like surface antigen